MSKNQEEYLKEFIRKFDNLKEFIDLFPSDTFNFKYENDKKWCAEINLDSLKPVQD